MDLSELRRKRLKLFHESSSSAPAAPPSAKQIIDLTMDSDDEPHTIWPPQDARVAISQGATMEGTPPSSLIFDESPEAVAIRAFTLPMLDRLSLHCHHNHLSTREKVLRHFQSIVARSSCDKGSAGSAKARSKARMAEGVDVTLLCSDCSSQVCYACTGSLGDTLSQNSHRTTVVGGLRMSPHCAPEAIALVWLLLCGTDSLTGETTASTPTKRPLKRTADSGVGYGYSEYDFEQYVNLDPPHPNAFTGQGHTLDGSAAPPKAPARAESPNIKDATKDDAVFAKMFAALAYLLTVLGRDDADSLTLLPVLLKESSIMEKAAALLGTGSLDDVIEKKELYNALFQFLQALGTYPGLALHTLHSSRSSTSLDQFLLKTSLGQPALLLSSKKRTHRPLTAWVSSFRRSADFFLEWVKRNEKAIKDTSNEEKIAMSQHIVEVAELVLKNAPARNDCEQEETINRLAWQKDLAFIEVEDEVMFTNNVYGREARNATNLRPERMKALAKDLEILHTSLPPNIFVRYGESRPDLMKILIVGPGDSPYEHGLYEFDLFAGETYPAAPPKMTFRTTGGGTAHFNPNLYQNGYVCLSLLGTWDGPGWNANRSTLLQIFISIQAMIFCKNPWCNEPGRENMADDPCSKRYNRTIQALAVRLGMLEWLGVKTKPFNHRRFAQTDFPPPPPPPPPPQAWAGLAPPSLDSQVLSPAPPSMTDPFIVDPFTMLVNAAPPMSNPHPGYSAPVDEFLGFDQPGKTPTPWPSLYYHTGPGHVISNNPAPKTSGPTSMNPFQGPFPPCYAPSSIPAVDAMGTTSKKKYPSPFPPSQVLDGSPAPSAIGATGHTLHPPLHPQNLKPFNPTLMTQKPSTAIPPSPVDNFPQAYHQFKTQTGHPKPLTSSSAPELNSTQDFFKQPPPPPPPPPPKDFHPQAFLDAIKAEMAVPPPPYFHPRLQNTAHPTPSPAFWSPVPKLHFEKNADAILQTVFQWTQTKLPIPKRNPRRSLWPGPGKTLGSSAAPPLENGVAAAAGKNTPNAPVKSRKTAAVDPTPVTPPPPGQDLVRGLQARLKTLEQAGSPGAVLDDHFENEKAQLQEEIAEGLAEEERQRPTEEEEEEGEEEEEEEYEEDELMMDPQP